MVVGGEGQHFSGDHEHQAMAGVGCIVRIIPAAGSHHHVGIAVQVDVAGSAHSGTHGLSTDLTIDGEERGAVFAGGDEYPTFVGLWTGSWVVGIVPELRPCHHVGIAVQVHVSGPADAGSVHTSQPVSYVLAIDGEVHGAVLA